MKVPASVDSDRQDVVVETLCGQTAHLRVCGDLSALQTLQAEHGEWGNTERLTKNGDKRPTWKKRNIFIGHSHPELSYRRYGLQGSDHAAVRTSHTDQVGVVTFLENIQAPRKLFLLIENPAGTQQISLVRFQGIRQINEVKIQKYDCYYFFYIHIYIVIYFDFIFKGFASKDLDF